MKIQIKIAFVHVLLPVPAEITQDQKQFVKYEGSAYFFSPYITRKQSTEFVCYQVKFASNYL